MAENDATVGVSELDERDTNSLSGIVVDGVIGAVGGAVGTGLMTLVFMAASTLGAFDLTSFTILAEMSGLAALAPAYANAIGYVIFLLGGMVTWPLLFASLGQYLPGDTFAKAGVFYGFILWTGFVLAFYTGYSGIQLPLYAAATLVGHVAYGFGLGSVLDYLGEREGPLV
ncbi:DUF6789 family protein [Natronomonas marina]|jgi:hypothetical protein|uniref:DUF6789 family protein n=1 Tax=Natronomonas marina TaxID=2961939 RepID=UPI0020C94EEC|nr:DUF6789 family protein [Natronomonas marina]